MNRALLTEAPWGRTAALLAHGAPLEMRLANPADEVGAIWRGRVLRVERGLGAFVDLGEDGTGLLTSGKPPHEGAVVLVQATRPATGDKGPALGAAPRLAGRYLVYTPRQPDVSASRRLPDDGTRTRLQGFARRLLQPGEGAVVRAAAAAAGDAAIVRELDMLRARWQRIDSAGDEAPFRLWREPDPLAAFLRDRLAAGGALMADRSLRRYVEQAGPPDARVELLQEPGWRAFGLEEAIQRALEPVVMLAGGGSLSIEQTRAGIVIDVDGGARRDVLALNLEAARVIAREIRLRGLGGLILIDFVDLDRAAERRRVERRLAEGFAADPAARRQLPVSPLGVIEMTRQRLGAPLAEQWAQCRRQPWPMSP